jgi:hypothetical protein
MWLAELSLTDEQVKRQAKLRHELTGALTTMIDKKKERTGPAAPWWWTGDDDASDSSIDALGLFQAPQ